MWEPINPGYTGTTPESWEPAGGAFPHFLSWEPSPHSTTNSTSPAVGPMGAGLSNSWASWDHTLETLWDTWLGPGEGPSWPESIEASVPVTAA